MSQKHLVLDPDVHERLKSRKRQRGMTLREIGNAILRSVLNHPALSDEIAKKLVSQGKISVEDYRRARDEVVRELDSFHRQVDEVLKATTRGTFVSGSWEVKVAQAGREFPYQIVDAWATDAKREPLPLHCHDASDEYLLVITGRVLFSMEEHETLLEEGQIHRIPAGRPHAATPLTPATRAVVIFCPPDPNLAAQDYARTPI